MSIQTLDVATLKKWLDNKDVVLIDVREVDEFKESSIPGSVNVPLSSFSSSQIPAKGNKKLVMSCARGRRSMTACEMLVKENPSLEVYNLEGGIGSWN